MTDTLLMVLVVGVVLVALLVDCGVLIGWVKAAMNRWEQSHERH